MGERATQMRAGDGVSLPVAATTKVEMGKLACLNASGYAVEGSESATLTAVGRFEETVDNSAGGNGDLCVDIRRGIFLFGNSGTDAVTQASVGKRVYIEDDETVSATDNDGARSAAGICLELTSDGVWVAVGQAESAAAVMGLLGSSHKVVAAGLHSWAGGAAKTDSIAVVGLLETDIVLVNVSARGAASPTTVIGVNDAGNDQIDLVMDQNGEDGVTKIAYAVLRA